MSDAFRWRFRLDVGAAGNRGDQPAAEVPAARRRGWARAEYVADVFAFAAAFESFADRLTGVAIVVSGGVLMVTARSRLAGLLLLASGASWLLPVVSGGPLSTLYVHRALLVAAFALAVEPLWRRTATTALVIVFGAVASVPAWSQTPWVLIAVWGAVLVRTSFVLTSSPRRVRAVPGIAAQLLMLAVAAIGSPFDLLTRGERRAVYFVATAALAAITVRVLRSPVTPESVLDERSGRAAWAIGLRPPGMQEFVTADGRSITSLPLERTIEFDVGPLGTAMLAHDDPAFEDPALRDRLGGVVRLVSERIALLHQIDGQRTAVEASRARLVEADRSAAWALRSDLGRDVHPYLDSIERALVMVDTAGTRPVRLLDEIRRELDDLASGSIADALSEGLGPALRSLADRSTVPAVVEVEPVEVDGAIALALFMVASEAITNVAKHSHSERLTLSLFADAACVTLCVTDSGRGGAVSRPGGGIAEAAARLAEVGGSLDVGSPPGGGTVVVARVGRPGATGSSIA